MKTVDESVPKKTVLKRLWYPLDFMGAFFVSALVAGLGPIFLPQMLMVVESIACPIDGYGLQVAVDAQRDSFHPGQTQFDVSLLCVNPGTGSELAGNPMAQVAFFGYLLAAIYAVALIGHNFPGVGRLFVRLKYAVPYFKILFGSAFVCAALTMLCVILTFELSVGGPVRFIGENPILWGSILFVTVAIIATIIYRSRSRKRSRADRAE